MGLQAGLGAANVRSWRVGICWDPDPVARAPQEFMYEVGEITERWSDGLSPPHVESDAPPFHVYASRTFTIESR